MTGGRIPTHPPSTQGTAVTGDEFVLPASSAQQRLWFIDGLRPGNPAYNIPAVFELRGALDLDALEHGIADLVRRHEALRTTFRDAADGLRQVIVPEVVSPPLEVVDLTGVASEERPHLRTELVQEFVRRVFDLRVGPLIAVAVLQWSDTECTLLVNVHHAVADGWSMAVLLRDLSQLYAVRVDGGEPTLPPLELQYGDYAVWQQKRLEAGAFDSQVAYWRQALAGAPQAIELPTDRPRPPQKTFEGGVEWLELTAGELAAVTAFARTQQVTPFLVLLAACAVVLGRYCRQEDVLIGTPLADRSRPETEALLGFLINTVVLRVDLSANPSIRELLRRLRDVAAGATANHDLPFDKVVEAVRPERDLSRTPLFQVMVAYQPDPLESLSLAGLTATSMPAHNATSKFDLLLGFEEHSLGLRGMLEYSTDLFDAPTIRRMAGHIRVVLAALVSNHPDRRIGELPMLTSAERQQVVVDFNDQPNQSFDRCIHHFFHAQAARTPTARAVIHPDETLTYEDLQSRTARLAAHLRSIGVARGSLVGVCLERSPQLIITVLAILEAGGAYVPLDPAYPQERLRFILEDTDAAVVVTSAKVRDALPRCSARLVDVAAITGDHTAQTTNDGLNGGADDLAYVIYTSGSTGRPKGVALEHRTAVAMIRWARGVYSDADLAGVLASTSVCFDLSVFEMFVPLSWGGAVVLAENALQLPFLPASGDVTLINTVPSAMTELLRMGNLPTGLRVAILAGERLRPRLVDEILGRTTISQVFDVYGPSETSYTTCASRGVGSPETIGRPLPGVRTYVLDRQRNPVPIGVPGELYIGGATVARGYLHRPELTAERFVADTFAPAGESMYASGDLARWMPNGDLEYLGRDDHQVKLRGYRIELGEVEATLRRHPDVTEAVVAVREDASGDQRLVAYLVVAAATTPGFASDVRGWLKTKLPDYMIPSAVVPMAAFPLTPNGKVDRSKLPAPAPTAPAAEMLAPRTDTERRLAEIWASVLRLEQHFGVEDNFFDLGGHSLLALRAVARIRQLFEVDVPLDEFFAHPTIAGLGRRVDTRRRTVASSHVSLPTPVGRPPGPAPLSFAQQRMWILDQLDTVGLAYVIPTALRIRGPLDVPVLGGALQALVTRHEALRTTFQLIDGELRQVVAEIELWSMQVVDLAGSVPDQAGLEELLRTEASRRFDLTRGPLFRACLYRLSEDTHILVLVMHHIVSDGWSMGVLFDELGALYTSGSRGQPAQLAPLALQYRDVARWQRHWLSGEVLNEQLSYWRRRLAGAPHELVLATDRRRPAVESHRGALYSSVLPRHLVDRLRRLSQQEGTTLFMTLVTGFSALLARYSGQDDLLIGTPVANRQRPEVEALVGCFVNTLVLRADLSGEPTVRELLARTRAVCLEAFANQDLPFERVVEDLHPNRDLSRNAMFQVMFALQNMPTRSLDLGGLEVAAMALDLHAAQFDLSLLACETPEGLVADFSYATDLFDELTISRFAAHWHALLEGMVSAPERQIGDLGLLGAVEQQALVDWNRTARDFPDNASVSRLFEAQVANAPDATAVVVGNDRLTYRDLNSHANRLAAYLQGVGVTAGAHVAVCMERSSDFVVAILAVLKAGCVYLPLDPGHPAPRLRMLIDDAGAAAVLTHRLTAAVWPGDGPPRIDIDDLARELASLPDDNPVGEALGGDLAYIMYTSGSTGHPKGVAIPHRAIVRLVVNTDYVVLGRADVVAQMSNQAFDAATFEIWGALLNGATLQVIDRETMLSPRRFAEALREHRITTMFLTSALFSSIAAHDPAAFGSLTQLIVGGDVVEPRWAAEVLRSGAPQRLLNGYGPTETTTFAAWHEIDEATAAGASIPIGRPIANTTLYVLDGRMRPVPVGVTGELYIGGPGLADGYLNDEGLTRERFVTAPFAGGGRLYRSGDAARYRPDGVIEFRGRLDAQVKLRGFRVEPGEVEATIARHPLVASATVVVREDEPGDKRLVAYLVGVEAESASLVPAVRDWLGTQLPDYMMPVLVHLPALPLTSNGKVDRAALPAPEKPGVPRTPKAFQTATEVAVANIWAEVLKLDEFDADDSFFDLGGHSLAALHVFVRIQDTFGVSLPLATLFEAPTVARLSAVIDASTPPAGVLAPATSETNPAGRSGGDVTGRDPDVHLSLDIIRRSPSLVAIQPAGTRPPFFVLPGAGGNILGFRQVARYLDPEQPVIGLESLGRDGRTVPLTSLRAIAARFIDEMRSLQPNGPYAIGGISWGGMAAFEMAQQLLASGQEVSLLALLDTVPSDPDVERPATVRLSAVEDLGQRLKGIVRAVLLASEGSRIDYLRTRLRRVRSRLDRRRWRRRNEIRTIAARLEAGDQLPLAEALRHVRQSNVMAFRDYRPARYDGEITLLYATERDEGDDGEAKWRAWADRITVRPVPGNHTTMLDEPHVRIVARELSDALERTHRKASPPLTAPE